MAQKVINTLWESPFDCDKKDDQKVILNVENVHEVKTVDNDYNILKNKPTLEGIPLKGELLLKDFGLDDSAEIVVLDIDDISEIEGETGGDYQNEHNLYIIKNKEFYIWDRSIWNYVPVLPQIDLTKYYTKDEIVHMLSFKVSRNDVMTMIDNRGYKTEAEIKNIIVDRSLASKEAENALNLGSHKASEYLLIADLELPDMTKYLTETETLDLLDKRNYQNYNQVNQIIDNKGYKTVDEIKQIKVDVATNADEAINATKLNNIDASQYALKTDIIKPDLSDYYTKTEVDKKDNNILKSAENYTDKKIKNIDLSGFALTDDIKQWDSEVLASANKNTENKVNEALSKTYTKKEIDDKDKAVLDEAKEFADKKFSVSYATFAIDPTTGQLIMSYPDDYTKPWFKINEKGHLEVDLNDK